MGSLFEMLYDILFQPTIGMKNIAEQKNVGQALVVFLLSMLIPIWALYFGLQATEMSAMIYVMIVLKILGSMLMWIMGASIWHLIAEFLGGRGTAVGLFTALGFAHVPRIFIVPLWALVAVMPASTKTLLMTIAVLVIMLWSLSLDIVAIKEVHQLSTSKAVLVIVTQMLVIGILGVIGFAFIGSSLGHMPMWL